jgi:hypothetical protein
MMMNGAGGEDAAFSFVKDAMEKSGGKGDGK